MSDYEIYLKVPKKKFYKHRKNYKGYAMKQADAAVEVFQIFFSEQKFDCIIEIGTGMGGFTLFLGEIHGNKLHTFDIVDKLDRKAAKDIKKRLFDLGVNIHIEDVFKTPTLKGLIDKYERVLILSDNGDKVREYRELSKLIKINDVLMIHDYFRNEKEYYSQSVWKCCAFMDKYATNKNLKPYYADIFKKVFWFCAVKVENDHETNRNIQ